MSYGWKSIVRILVRSRLCLQNWPGSKNGSRRSAQHSKSCPTPWVLFGSQPNRVSISPRAPGRRDNSPLRESVNLPESCVFPESLIKPACIDGIEIGRRSFRHASVGGMPDTSTLSQNLRIVRSLAALTGLPCRPRSTPHAIAPSLPRTAGPLQHRPRR